MTCAITLLFALALAACTEYPTGPCVEVTWREAMDRPHVLDCGIGLPWDYCSDGCHGRAREMTLSGWHALADGLGNRGWQVERDTEGQPWVVTGGRND